jgi:hypothetical protein
MDSTAFLAALELRAASIAALSAGKLVGTAITSMALMISEPDAGIHTNSGILADAFLEIANISVGRYLVRPARMGGI